MGTLLLRKYQCRFYFQLRKRAIVCMYTKANCMHSWHKVPFRWRTKKVMYSVKKSGIKLFKRLLILLLVNQGNTNNYHKSTDTHFSTHTHTHIWTESTHESFTVLHSTSHSSFWAKLSLLRLSVSSSFVDFHPENVFVFYMSFIIKRITFFQSTVSQRHHTTVVHNVQGQIS